MALASRLPQRAACHFANGQGTPSKISNLFASAVLATAFVAPGHAIAADPTVAGDLQIGHTSLVRTYYSGFWRTLNGNPLDYSLLTDRANTFSTRRIRTASSTSVATTPTGCDCPAVARPRRCSCHQARWRPMGASSNRRVKKDVECKLEPFRVPMNLLKSMPGASNLVAQTILAEIGLLPASRRNTLPGSRCRLLRPGRKDQSRSPPRSSA
jgi:hypothetical protein